MVLTREPLGSSATQREQIAAWDEALRASGLPVAGADLDPPRPRFALAAPLAGAVRGEAELADLYLVERVPAWQVRDALERSLPAGYALREAFDVWVGEAALPGQVVASVYRAPVPSDGRLHDACRTLLDAPTIERERMKGSGPVRYDLRPFIEALEVGSTDARGAAILRMTLRHDPARGIGRPDEVLAALGDELGHDISVPIGGLVRERLVLAPPASPAPPRPRGPRRVGQAATPPSRARK